MNTVITTTKGFINHMQPGMKFWTIESGWDEPIKVQGPITFIGYTDDSRNIAITRENGSRREQYLSDLTNKFHGVCHTAKLAHQLFTIRKHQWEKRTHEEIAEYNINLRFKKNSVLSLR